ncbi:MAG: EF-P 5-aminopentanol modification-associated protein YfmF [Bacillota bacterium]
MPFELAPAGDFLMAELAEGVRFFGRRLDKFKTTNLGGFVHRPLVKESVTATALAAQLLKRGSRRHPSTRALTIRTEELYGAGLDSYIMKYGESQSIGASLGVVDRSYLPGSPDVLRDGLGVFFELLTDPVTEDGGFRRDYFGQERDNLRRRIEGVINDKQRYARFRCLQEMCPDEGYGLLEIGRLEDLPGLDPVGVYDGYRRMLAERPIDLVAVGPVDPDQLAGRVADLVPRDQGRRTPFKVTGAAPPPLHPREVIEEQAVKQGKLVMGFRTGITQGDPDYPALLGYNGVLGGFVHSKLFQNVREKASLAYYAHSGVNGAKGFIIIESGIDPANYERAREIIGQQVTAIREGDISDGEFESTKKALHNVIRQGEDDPSEMIAIQLAQARSGRFRTIQQRLEEISGITRDGIVGVAGRVTLDTIYFLRGRQGGDQR